MRFLAILFMILVSGFCAMVTQVIASPASVSSAVPIIYTSAPRYDATAWLQGRERFPQGATLMIRAEGKARKLVPDFAASADANVSFDGKSVLFAGRRTATDPWQIWELVIGDGTSRRVLTTAQDAVKPLYLPEGRIVFARKSDTGFVVETLSLSNGKPLPLLFAPGSALPTDILRDGRILFEAGYPLGTADTPETYTVYSDGSGVEGYRCDHGKARYAAKETASGDIVFTRGRGLGIFTSRLAHDAEVTAPTGDYSGDVSELPGGRWLLSVRASSAKLYELKSWKPGSKSLASLHSDPEANLIQAVPVVERKVPNRHPSGLHANWNYANLLVLNAYSSRSQVAPGTIAQVQLYTQESGVVKALGTAPVEQDGSFFIQVPGDSPLRMELLDASGKTLAQESGWWYARSGEQRICVGCHAGPERAPDNAVPAVLLRTTIPVDLTGNAPVTPASKTGGN